MTILVVTFMVNRADQCFFIRRGVLQAQNNSSISVTFAVEIHSATRRQSNCNQNEQRN